MSNAIAEVRPFVSSHGLAFEEGKYEPLSHLGRALQQEKPWKKFHIGTCEGLWGVTDTDYEILAVVNDKPGNGHFRDVLEWFEQSCRRDGKALRILQVWNADLLRHLTTKKGFVREGEDAVKIYE
jgi:hypothetical protein